MIRRTLTPLTMIAIAMHALLGCCAHHHHMADAEAVFHVHAAGKPLAAGHHSCGHHADPEDANHEQGDHEPCDELDCQFVTTPRSEDSSLELSSLFDVAVVVGGILAMDVSSDWSAFSRTDHPPLRHLSPHARRAQTQVWLI